MIKSQRQKIQKGKKCKDLKTVKIGQGEGYRGVKKKSNAQLKHCWIELEKIKIVP